MPMPFEGDYTQERYAQQLIDEYLEAGIRPSRVFAQSFHREDVLYWLEQAPAFGRQAVFLDARVDTPEGYAAAVAGMPALAAGAREDRDTDRGAVRVPDRAAARELLTEVLVPGDVVLVKASRSYGLEVLAADLLAAGAGA